MSPIKGISETVWLPVLGKIRLGIKEEGSNGQLKPVPTDYFVCPDEVKKVYGEKPKEFRIMFPNEDREQWASQYFQCYSESGNLICSGTGELVVRKFDLKPSNIDEIQPSPFRIPCIPSTCLNYQQDVCHRVMNLRFLLPDCPGFGAYQLDTGSFYSMRNINDFLNLLENVCQRVSMIPLTLQLVEQPVRPEGNKKIAYVLKLTSNLSLVEAQKFSQIPPGKALLPPPDFERPDDLQEKVQDHIPSPHDEDQLINLWTKAVSRIFHHGIQDFQIVNWFEKQYHIMVRPKDFESPLPPARFTADMLSAFIEAIDRYTNLS
jgi:hypothetical protein